MELLNTPTAYLWMDKTLPNEYLAYETKQFDNEIPVMLELWETRSTPSLLLPGLVATDRVRSMGQIDLNCVLM